jgi:predicted nuclease of predicted toxin-antitoxin system
VKGILADVNIQGYVDQLVFRMQAEPWKLFWDYLHLRYVHFADIGLAQSTLDSLVWAKCQQEELVLITDNRNQKDVDSLEATIQTFNSPTCLPVFTIANVSQLRASRDYADRVIDTLLDLLLRIEALRGSGRLYVP